MLAKVLINKPDILLIDEKGISIENDDMNSMEIIFRNLIDSTFIMVLNQFYNILTFDYIYVLENGAIKEEGKPKVLIKNSQSTLNALMKANEPILFRDLKGYLDGTKGKVEISSLKKVLKIADQKNKSIMQVH